MAVHVEDFMLRFSTTSAPAMSQLCCVCVCVWCDCYRRVLPSTFHMCLSAAGPVRKSLQIQKPRRGSKTEMDAVAQINMYL